MASKGETKDSKLEKSAKPSKGTKTTTKENKSKSSNAQTLTFPVLDAVRNEWNHARSNLYAAAGEQTGRSFCALADDENAAYAWPRKRRLNPDDSNVAASVAVWRALLVPTVELVDPLLRQGDA